MRKIREVIRLKFSVGLGRNAIARSLGIAEGTVTEYLGRAVGAGLSWPLPDGLSDGDLEGRLYPVTAPTTIRPCPDWAEVHRQMARKGVTLELLWQEYRITHPNGYGYSQYCKLYRQWRTTVDLVMRQSHAAGEKLFVDYAGQTIDVVEAATGEVRQAQIFVATLGASNYTYAEATPTQELACWIASQQRAFAFFGGVPEIIVPDNLKSAVTTPHRYEPELNRAYAEMAEYYGVAILPARSRKPRDKAKVENGVQVVERWILAPLRDRTFFGFDELNDAIAVLLAEMNDRPFQKLPGSRRSAFEAIDRPALRALPSTPYCYATWKKVRVNIDYHIEVEGHYYSVPYTYARREIDVRISDGTVECIAGTVRIASHVRSPHRGRHTTVAAHMPRSHQEYAGWTPLRLIAWAEKTGEATAEVVARLIASREHPQQAYRSCLGIMRLGKSYGSDRLEAAAHRAITIGAVSYKSIESILKKGLDRQELRTCECPPSTESIVVAHPIEHANIRGAAYYNHIAYDTHMAYDTHIAYDTHTGGPTEC
jgi:transposase